MSDERDILTGDPGDEQTIRSTSQGTGDAGTSDEVQDRVSEDQSRGSASQNKDVQAQSQNQELTEEQKEKEVAKALVFAHQRRLVAFNLFEIKKKAPKALKALIDYMIKVSEFQDIDEQTATGILFYSPGAVLSNFFDDNGVFVIVGGDENSWHYNISGAPAKIGFKNRSEAIVAGNMEAFEILEQKL